MVLLIALRLPALGFCLCQNDLVLNGSPCCTGPMGSSAPVSSSSCQGCESCPLTDSGPCTPCEDCVVVLSLDPGDFLWSSGEGSPSQEEGAPPSFSRAAEAGFSPPLRVSLPAGLIRGSPPPGAFLAFLRTQVLRL